LWEECVRIAYMFGFGKTLVDTDPDKVDGVLSRSVAEILPTKDALKKRLLSGERIRIYIGADATGAELHLGHSTNFLLLEEFRRLGHEVIVLFGDFTALVGDPTDKDVGRQKLTWDEVQKNIAGWREQVSKILSFDGDNPAQIKKNSEWFSELPMSDMLEVASNFTVQHMLERDMFEKRIEEGKPVYLHEFLYPVLQGYDSVAMDVDVEVGGTDQTFNMLAGRTLQKKMKNKEKFVISTTLLTNPRTGKKLMSKSEGGYVALSDNSEDMYGKVMALPDEVLNQMFVDCTRVPLSEIDKIMKEHPRDSKMCLAREIVSMYHGAKEAKEAEENFVSTFKEQKPPSDIPIFRAKSGAFLTDILLDSKMASSKTDARRLLKDGAVMDMDTQVKIVTDTVEKTMTLRIGKKRFLKIEIKN
jgi:tyrosyl-tRNA synthetase